MRTRPAPTLATAVSAAVAALVLAACGSTDPDPAEPGASTAPPPASTAPSAGGSASGSATATTPTTPAGAYLTLADYRDRMSARQGTAVVYFFHASWCPTCRAAEEAIERDGIPDGLTVVKVDYDTETDLRREYGVTTQHTFVQVDADGAELAKWTGSRDGAEILAKTV